MMISGIIAVTLIIVGIIWFFDYIDKEIEDTNCPECGSSQWVDVGYKGYRKKCLDCDYGND